MAEWTQPYEHAVAIFRANGGMMRTADALRSGIHPRTLYALRDDGHLDQVRRGLYRLADAEPLAEHDLVVVAATYPRAVICLVSALAYHDITTEIPHAVAIALPKGAEQPRLTFPPLDVYRFSGAAYEQGREQHEADGQILQVYSPEKTLADCFKFRQQLGMSVCQEALRLYRERKPIRVEELLHFADIFGVSRVMKPYLETIIGVG
jgi:predicted transcriptional regulator of viral defense system